MLLWDSSRSAVSMSSISTAARVRVREVVGVGRRGIVWFARSVFGLRVVVCDCCIVRSLVDAVFA